VSEILSITNAQADSKIPRTRLLGSCGEHLAAEFLVNIGYRLVISNFTVPIGRNSRGAQVTGELDIIALDGATLVFIEVKTRRSEEFLPVITAVDRKKQRQVARTARVYRRLFKVFDMPYRYDVITVLVAKHADPVIEHVPGYWTDAVLKKRAWSGDSWYHSF
jgi:putative endonuclease